MNERMRWTDDRLDDKFTSLERAINSLPNRVNKIENKLGSVAEDVSESKAELRLMHTEFRASRQGLSRGEKIALLGSGAGFIGALAAAAAVLGGAA